jgi:carboxypeptidase D
MLIRLFNFYSPEYLFLRYTANWIDLNRNFPDYLGATLESFVRANETRAVMTWLESIPFVLSANFHGGAFTVNVPYDRYCE